MIREDVWEYLRSLTLDDWQEGMTSERLREMALKAVDEELEQRVRRKTLTPDQEIEALREALHRMGVEAQGSFRYYLGSYVGESGLSFRAAFELGLSMTEDVEEMRAFAIDLADTLFVQWAYATLDGQWHPSTNAGQEGRWEQHRAFHRKLAEIQGMWEDESTSP
jgi:hypothetical protein